MAQNDILIGRRLANFQVERPIGRGGMAQVYYGTDIKLKRPVAIKVIDARFRDNPNYAKRFVQEAQRVATWQHENIIHIYYADDEDGFYYYVMEYVEGQDFSGLMAKYQRQKQLMPYSELLHIGRGVAKGLDYAHKKGVVHRDIKPANVMVSAEGRVVVMDFGIAMDVEEGSLGEVFGSARYVAPEQVRNSSESVPQSDQYALGIMMYEALTGRVPFPDASPTTAAIHHLTLPPPSPRELNPNITVETEAVILKALAKSPQQRYQNCLEFINALTRSLSRGGELIVTDNFDLTLPSRLPTPLPAEAFTEPSPKQLPPDLTSPTRVLPPDETEATVATPLPLPPPPPPPADVTTAPPNQTVMTIGGIAAALLLLFLGYMIFNSNNNNLKPTAVASVATEITQPATVALTHTSTATPTPTHTPQPTATLTPTLIVPTFTPTPLAPMVLADSKLDFTNTLTGSHWSYVWSKPGTQTWQPLENYKADHYGKPCWYTSPNYVRVCNDFGNPGNNANIAWLWTSTVSGSIELKVQARKVGKRGDGVVISIYKDSTDTFPLLESPTAEGLINETISVKAIQLNEYIYFVMDRNGNETADDTDFRAIVCQPTCP